MKPTLLSPLRSACIASFPSLKLGHITGTHASKSGEISERNQARTQEAAGPLLGTIPLKSEI
jgi:hypothetical protein